MKNDALPLTQSWIKKIGSLRTKKNREKNKLTIIEGEKLFLEAYDYYRHQIEILVVTARTAPILEKVMPEFTIYQCQEKIMDKISLDKTPCGILAVIKTETEKRLPQNPGNCLFLNSISDPGNLGTIIRTAEAFGVGHIILDQDCVESSNPKCVRAAMGSYFRANIIEDVSEEKITRYIKKNSFSVYCLDGKGRESIWDAKIEKPFFLMVGNEARGILDSYKAKYTTMRIPMNGQAESLNASISCAIALSVLTHANKEIT